MRGWEALVELYSSNTCGKVEVCCHVLCSLPGAGYISALFVTRNASGREEPLKDLNGDMKMHV